MWEMIERMATDCPDIYTALAGPYLEQHFWFKDTRMATRAVAKFDSHWSNSVIRWG